MMLQINDLTVAYGGIEALKGIALQVEAGRIVTLVGANGAGKSTTLRTIMGLVKPVRGSVIYQGTDLLKEKTENLTRLGVNLVPEGRRVFADLSVVENLRIGAFCRNDPKGIQSDLEWVYSLFPILKTRSWQPAGTLSGGEQQMLAVGRALMARPKLLMMDEPSLGLAPLVVRDIFTIIREIHRQGVTILLIEQNAKAALELADMGYVMETGRIILSGPGRELLHNEKVKAAYLGQTVARGVSGGTVAQ